MAAEDVDFAESRNLKTKTSMVALLLFGNPQNEALSSERAQVGTKEGRENKRRWRLLSLPPFLQAAETARSARIERRLPDEEQERARMGS
jgi:hypothetical protein